MEPFFSFLPFVFGSSRRAFFFLVFPCIFSRHTHAYTHTQRGTQHSGGKKKKKKTTTGQSEFIALLCETDRTNENNRPHLFFFGFWHARMMAASFSLNIKLKKKKNELNLMGWRLFCLSGWIDNGFGLGSGGKGEQRRWRESQRHAESSWKLLVRHECPAGPAGSSPSCSYERPRTPRSFSPLWYVTTFFYSLLLSPSQIKQEKKKAFASLFRDSPEKKNIKQNKKTRPVPMGKTSPFLFCLVFFLFFFPRPS